MSVDFFIRLFILFPMKCCYVNSRQFMSLVIFPVPLAVCGGRRIVSMTVLFNVFSLATSFFISVSFIRIVISKYFEKLY